MSSLSGDIKLQIITLGDHTVGKTSILKRFNDNSFSLATHSTIGVDFVSKSMTVGDTSVNVKIWDTAGQDRFHTITYNFYKPCQGVLLVFDVGARASLAGISRWMERVSEHANKSIIKFLVANKIDVERREVTQEEAKKLADKCNMKYFEVSAKTGENVMESISEMVNDICRVRHKIGKENGFKISDSGTRTLGKSKCC
eukprot:TRINITY_DN7090_c0_g1_i1.p1 TRINITY_DN7090_c0_g1~~TRINITY_DN7090_c0_g1_i1.p1  ORF type:complete len:199 (+),score=57.93 TRINITY_DN7090_c0_g1_i1:159-755(+)